MNRQLTNITLNHNTVQIIKTKFSDVSRKLHFTDDDSQIMTQNKSNVRSSKNYNITKRYKNNNGWLITLFQVIKPRY